jgi:hypothetical protein
MAQNTTDDTCGSQVWSQILSAKNNMTALQTIRAPPWVSASEFRGTIAIVQSCLLTLVACIYTALHLNVPKKKDWRSLLLLKTQWVLAALFAPELVLYHAATQFFQARKLRNRLWDLQNGLSDDERVGSNK